MKPVRASSKICAIIPVHDEAPTIARVVAECRPFCDAVVVVDDGSADESGAIAARAGAVVVRHRRRRGKGAAIRSGAEAALAMCDPSAQDRIDALLFLDGDGQHMPSEIPEFLARFRRGASVIVGDRSEHFERMSTLRSLTNRAMSTLLSKWFLAPDSALRDSQCGFRLVSTDVWTSLPLRCGHFDLESEVLVEANRRGHRLVSVPVSVRGRQGRSRIRVVPDTGRFLRLLARLSWRSRSTKSVRWSTGDLHGC